MGEMRINAACDDFSVDLLEFFDPIRKRQNLSWTYKGAADECIEIIKLLSLFTATLYHLQIQWIEEEDDVFSNVIGQG